MRTKFLFLIIMLSICMTLTAKHKEYPQYFSSFTYSEDIEEKADEGDDMAMLLTGLHYLPNNALYKLPTMTDRHHSNDIKKATNLIKKAASKGNPLAMIVYGQILKFENYPNKIPDSKIYLTWVEKAAKTGYPDAYALMSTARDYITEQGKTSYSMVQTILNDLNTGINLGSGLCAAFMAQYYMTGRFDNVLLSVNCPPNYKKAIDLYKKAVELGTPSQYVENLAKLYYEGIGTDKNIDYSLYYYAISNDFQCIDSNLKRYFEEGAFGGEKNTQFDVWKKMLKENCDKFFDNGFVFGKPEILHLTLDIYAKYEHGAYYLTDKDGVLIYPHFFNSIQAKNDTVIAKYKTYSMKIFPDGSISEPIGYQLLKRFGDTESLINAYQLLSEVLAYDYNNSEGVASVACTNFGAMVEESFRSNQSAGVKKKKVQAMIDANRDKMNHDKINSTALLCYDRALEYDPYSEFALHNAGRLQSNLKDEPKTSFWDYASVTTNGMLQIFSNTQSVRNYTLNVPSSGVNKGNSSQNNAKSKGGAGVARNNVGANQNYYGYEDRLRQMKDGYIEYNNSDRKQWQNRMKAIREEQKRNGGFNIPKSPLEDWGGK